MTPDPIQALRDRALACMILALCLCAAAFLSTYDGSDARAIEGARVSVALHEGLLRDTSAALLSNQEALRSTRAYLESLRAARH
ncbi:MAG TPA: hypothetical protein VII43_03765 [Opitutaceae bacterium]